MNIIESLKNNGWVEGIYEVDNVVDVGCALLCFKESDIIGVYTDYYERIDNITVGEQELMLYYRGILIKSIQKKYTSSGVVKI